MAGTFILFTGLPSAGKSTLAQAVKRRLLDSYPNVVLLDGDVLRQGPSADLGFSLADRRKHLLRVGGLAKPMVDSGTMVLAAMIAPIAADRAEFGALFGPQQFVEVYCRCPLEECERRDVKGLYRRARKGEINDFTGVSSPYEPPINPAVTVNTHIDSIERCVEQVVQKIKSMYR